MRTLTEKSIVCLIFGFCLLNAYLTVDFGYQWDEWTSIEPVRRLVRDGDFLPHTYIYPSFCPLLSTLGLAPSLFTYLWRAGPEQSLYQFILQEVFKDQFGLTVRFVFAAVSALTLIWVYMTAARWRPGRGEGAIAAAMIALSWEVSYHSKWVVPNTIMMQWAGLLILLLDGAQRALNFRPWLLGAACVAGIAMGTKYQCGLMLIPIYLILLDKMRAPPAESSRWRLAGLGIALWMVFWISYLVTTPGTILDWGKFYEDVTMAISVYRNGHVGATVGRGSEHLWLMSVYLASVLFSWYMPISLFFFGLFLLGACSALREEGWKTIVFLSFPLAYFLYFGLTQKVMHVRNLMVLVPYIALLAARGWSELSSSRRAVALSREGATALLAVCLMVNLDWMIWSSGSVMKRRSMSYPHLAHQYLSRHPDKRFVLSLRVANGMARQNLPIPPNATVFGSAPVDQAMFSSEDVFWTRWLYNRRDYTETWIGPFEMNFNYYPTWNGQHRIVVMDYSKVGPLEVFPNVVLGPMMWPEEAR